MEKPSDHQSRRLLSYPSHQFLFTRDLHAPCRRTRQSRLFPRPFEKAKTNDSKNSKQITRKIRNKFVEKVKHLAALSIKLSCFCSLWIMDDYGVLGQVLVTRLHRPTSPSQRYKHEQVRTCKKAPPRSGRCLCHSGVMAPLSRRTSAAWRGRRPCRRPVP